MLARKRIWTMVEDSDDDEPSTKKAAAYAAVPHVFDAEHVFDAAIESSTAPTPSRRTTRRTALWW